jgi:hypothetical protein
MPSKKKKKETSIADDFREWLTRRERRNAKPKKSGRKQLTSIEWRPLMSGRNGKRQYRSACCGYARAGIEQVYAK